MLPFLKNKKHMAGLIVQHREPDSKDEPKELEHEDRDELEIAAEDIISAIHSRSADKLAVALRAAFELMEKEPHEEGPHTNEDDFDSMNAKAAKESR